MANDVEMKKEFKSSEKKKSTSFFPKPSSKLSSFTRSKKPPSTILEDLLFMHPALINLS
jgi:hypothetical protein